MMIADHHNRYDFGEWTPIVAIAVVACATLGFILKMIYDDRW